MSDPVTHRLVVSLDGGGVVADEPLLFGEGRRLRVHLTGDPSQDATIYVEGGMLHVVGQYLPVRSRRTAANHVEVGTGTFAADAL